MFAIGATQGSKPNDDVNVKNCLVSYLQSKNLAQELTSSQKESSCNYETILQQAHDNIDTVVDKLSQSDLETDVNCISEKLKLTGFADQFLLKLVYSEASQSTEELKQKQRQTDQEIEKLFFDSILSCDEVQEYLNQFLSKEDVVDHRTNKFELYCVHKHAIDNNLLNIKKYNIDLSDPEIENSNIDCQTAIAINRESMDAHFKSEEFTDKESDCIIKKNHEIKYFDHFTWIETMKIARANEAQKVEERLKYKDFYLKAMKSIFDCSHGI